MKNNNIRTNISSQNIDNINIARKRNEIFRKFYLAFKLFVISVVILFFTTSLFDNIKQKTRNHYYDFISKYLDFKLSKIIVDGQENISTNEIVRIINTKINDPILGINIKNIQTKLEKNDWVKRAIIERRLPNKLYVGIIERKPIAKWQYQKKIMLIDDEAIVIQKRPKQDYQGLILVVGSDAYLHANDLIESTKKNKELHQEINAAIRYGERRWDIKFKDNLTAKMPENNFNEAWNYLVKLNKADKLFSQNIRIIDLRDKEKYYITRGK